MVAVSRELFNKIVENQNCRIIHPEHPSCLVCLRDLGAVVLKGTAKYFFFVYLAQNALKYKTLTASDIRPIVVSYVRSCLFGVWAVCSCTAVVCLSVTLLGTVDKNVVAYVVGGTSGCGIFLDSPKRRPIVAYSLSALAAEGLIRRLYRKIKRRPTLETLAFMVLNGILMYKMRVTEHARTNRDIWFYRPPRVVAKGKVEETLDVETGETLLNACPHTKNGCSVRECYDSVMKETTKYYVGALMFSAVKLIFTKPKLRRDPISFLKTLFQWNNLKASCFFGWYIGVYKGLSCALCRLTKKDKSEYALLAGFLAGLSYGFNRNLTAFASLMLYVTRIFGREFQEKYKLPDFQFVEISTILALMTLINTRIFDPENCPEGFKFILSMVTRGKLDCAFSEFFKLIEEQLKKEM